MRKEEGNGWGREKAVEDGAHHQPKEGWQQPQFETQLGFRDGFRWGREKEMLYLCQILLVTSAKTDTV